MDPEIDKSSSYVLFCLFLLSLLVQVDGMTSKWSSYLFHTVEDDKWFFFFKKKNVLMRAKQDNKVSYWECKLFTLGLLIISAF